MMGRIKLIVSLALVLAFFFACAHSPERAASGDPSPVLSRILQRGELIVGTSAKQPPLNGLDKEGRVIGLEPDLARLMAGALGVRVDFQTMPFFELLPALEAGKVDIVISGMSITPKRNSKVAFVGPYFVSGRSFVTKAQTIASLKDPAQINRPETILAALKGSTSQIFVEKVIPKATLILTEDHQEALQLVLEGKAHAMIADHHVCVLCVLLFPEEKLLTLEKPLTYEPFGIALPANDPLLINLVENFLGTLQGSGDLERLKERWFKKAFWGRETLHDTHPE
jgi:polar amino acid transport system substrate-binding protein